MASRGKHWRGDWSVAVRLQIKRRKQAVLDERSADLLAALDQTGSITLAARLLGISYRHAWLLLRETNASAGEPLTEAAVGGKRGGGTQLTEAGRSALRVFRDVQTAIRKSAAKTLQVVLQHQTDEQPTIHLFAAISLQEVIGELLAEYSLAYPTVSVRAIFGASNALADQILAGSPADVFVSASSDEIDRLVAAGMIRRGSRRILAQNGLAVVATIDMPTGARRPADLPKVSAKQFVVADPTCPLGHYTADYLQAAGVYDRLRPRLVQVDNSRAVLSALRDRKSAVGVIFGSDLGNASRLQTLFRVPLGKVEASYEGAILSSANSPKQAKSLLDFLAAREARACFQRCGFVA
ncbi:MAG TPA: molybdate ABC transporter substrate-binding protein [Pirellulales bacterium]|nr:molybdate ABC transporter substrate-binding protein [Pirellulales bacterium]